MPKHGKKFRKVTEAIDSLKTYDVAEAMDLVLKSSFAKFDETVDVAVNLGAARSGQNGPRGGLL